MDIYILKDKRSLLFFFFDNRLSIIIDKKYKTNKKNILRKSSFIILIEIKYEIIIERIIQKVILVFF